LTEASLLAQDEAQLNVPRLHSKMRCASERKYTNRRLRILPSGIPQCQQRKDALSLNTGREKLWHFAERTTGPKTLTGRRAGCTTTKPIKSNALSTD